jgi:ribosomal protein L11 methyltransferase
MLIESGWKLALITPESAVEQFAMALDPFCYGLSAFEIEEGGNWRVEGFAGDMPPQDNLTAAVALAALRAGVPEPRLDCVPIPATDWVAETQKSFQPLRAGRYFIQPSHYDGAIPAGSIALTIDAGAAFGTGEHATTKGCLLALDQLAKRRRFAHMLDLGCGSGILAMAMAATWRRKVLAGDIDPEAVNVARQNFQINRLTPLTRAYVSRGFSARELRAGRPYDLITANILARPLISLAGAIRHHTAAGGAVILSGLLSHQENMVAAAYRAAAFHLIHRITIDEWRTLVFVL